MLHSPNTQIFDYIVVGSGAGGGTVAARLAEAGHRVLLLEAGGDPRAEDRSSPATDDPRGLPADYDVPAFHAFASEHDELSWSFFVHHRTPATDDQQDPKYCREFRGRPVDGLFYPRAATLGGCTAHNAMIFVYPSNADWTYIAGLTGDRGWSAASMRQRLQRLEECRHRRFYRLLARLGINPTRHGWRGWLPTEVAIPLEALTDSRLRRVVLESARHAVSADGHLLQRLRWLLRGQFDPNDWRLVTSNAWGIRYLPLTTRRHARVGSRERVRDVERRYPEHLTVWLHTLATEVLLDADCRAYGVAYRQGERLYRAHATPSDRRGEAGEVYASREVILAGGAFNSPQLLMLSGIGPPEVLAAHGIRVRVPLPGVGANLQDRLEASVVSKMAFDEWAVYKDARFTNTDGAFRKWMRRRGGLYATNGSVLALFRRSAVAGTQPDLFCMALLANFAGYVPGYSQGFVRDRNCLTWVVLKAHVQCNRGRVTLVSKDPLDPPAIAFEQSRADDDEDVRAVVDGLQFVRRLNASLADAGLISKEILPGPARTSDADLAEYVRTHAWGHHASGTCAIGPAGGGGVVDARCRVHQTHGLRVVDASIFPRIPGFFIASAVYLAAEKAADDILEDAFTIPAPAVRF